MTRFCCPFCLVSPARVALWAFTLLLVALPAQAQRSPQVSVGTGVVFGGEDRLYLDEPVDDWLDRNSGPLLNATIQWPLTASFLGGAYLEYESIDTDFSSGSRIGLGATFTGRYLPTANTIGLEAGGMVGFGFASADELDGQSGLEFGTSVGPVYRASPTLLVAAHLQSLYGFYDGGDIPEGIQNISIRLAVRVHYTL